MNGSDAVGGKAAAGQEYQRWTAARKSAIVLDIIKCRATTVDVARLHELTVADVESWVDKLLERGKEGPRAVPREFEAKCDAERNVHGHFKRPSAFAADGPAGPRRATRKSAGGEAVVFV